MLVALLLILIVIVIFGPQLWTRRVFANIARPVLTIREPGESWPATCSIGST